MHELIPLYSLQPSEVDPKSINKKVKQVSLDSEACSQNNIKAGKLQEINAL